MVCVYVLHLYLVNPSTLTWQCISEAITTKVHFQTTSSLKKQKNRMSLWRGKMKSKIWVLLRARKVTVNGRRYQDKHFVSSVSYANARASLHLKSSLQTAREAIFSCSSCLPTLAPSLIPSLEQTTCCDCGHTFLCAHGHSFLCAPTPKGPSKFLQEPFFLAQLFGLTHQCQRQSLPRILLTVVSKEWDRILMVVEAHPPVGLFPLSFYINPCLCLPAPLT